MQAAVLTGELFLLLQVHAAIGLGQKLLGILAILWIDRLADTEGKNLLPTNLEASLLGQGPHLLRLSASSVGRKAGGYDHEFVSPHARDVIVLAATVFERLGKQPQHAVALEVAETVVDLLEPIHVRDHHGHG